MDAQRYWSDIAGPKWAAEQAYMDKVFGLYDQALLEAATAGPGSQLVDVGCGCGASTLLAAQRSPQAQVLALDLSPAMLEVAKQRAATAGLDNIIFRLCDAATEPVPSNSIDRILSRFGVMFFTDPAAAFRHFRGWLKNDGRMDFIVWGPFSENAWLAEPTAVVHACLPQEQPPTPLPFSLGSKQMRDDLWAAVGLRETACERFDQPLRMPGDLQQLVTFYTGRGPIAAALSAAASDARQEALAALQTYVSQRHDGTGITAAAVALHLTLRPR